MSPDDSNNRTEAHAGERIAVLETQMREQRDDTREMKADLHEINQKMSVITNALSEFRGGRKALFGLLAAASALGALAMAFVTYVWPRS